MGLQRKKIAILVEDFYQDLEVWYSILRLREEGAKVRVIGPQKRTYKGKYGYPIDADADERQAKVSNFDAVIIPGGWAPDRLRLSKRLVEFVRQMDKAGKVVASICHGGWVLASAGIVKGRTVTSYIAIKDDLVNAGARFVDREVVRDGNLITSRKPDDLPAFLRMIIETLGEAK
jgi:protease I